MKKAALIVGLVAFILTLGGTVISPICTPCVVFFLGAISGYLAPVFDKPLEKPLALKRGGYAGAFSGIGALIGQIGGATINAILVGPEGAVNFARNFGLPTGTGFDTGYWFGMAASTLCISGFNILLMAGMGVLGALIWWQLQGNKMSQPQY